MKPKRRYSPAELTVWGSGTTAAWAVLGYVAVAARYEGVQAGLKAWAEWDAKNKA